jgi:hypothetical protein
VLLVSGIIDDQEKSRNLRSPKYYGLRVRRRRGTMALICIQRRDLDAGPVGVGTGCRRFLAAFAKSEARMSNIVVRKKTGAVVIVHPKVATSY